MGVELVLPTPLDTALVVGALVLAVLVAWRGVKVRITSDDRKDDKD